MWELGCVCEEAVGKLAGGGWEAGSVRRAGALAFLGLEKGG